MLKKIALLALGWYLGKSGVLVKGSNTGIADLSSKIDQDLKSIGVSGRAMGECRCKKG